MSGIDKAIDKTGDKALGYSFTAMVTVPFVLAGFLVIFPSALLAAALLVITIVLVAITMYIWIRYSMRYKRDYIKKNKKWKRPPLKEFFKSESN